MHDVAQPHISHDSVPAVAAPQLRLPAVHGLVLAGVLGTLLSVLRGVQPPPLSPMQLLTWRKGHAAAYTSVLCWEQHWGQYNQVIPWQPKVHAAGVLGMSLPTPQARPRPP